MPWSPKMSPPEPPSSVPTACCPSAAPTRSIEDSVMKVLFNCNVPFMLAHGGAQIQIEQTKAALEQIGVETAFLEWWNDRQTGDLLHHFGAPSSELIRLARVKGWKAINTILLSETCNRPRWALLLRRVLIRAAMAAPLQIARASCRERV